MRYSTIFLVTLLCLSTVAPTWADDTLVIRNATVIDVAGGGNAANDIEDAVIVIRHGRIDAVGPAADVALPDDVRVFDGGADMSSRV